MRKVNLLIIAVLALSLGGCLDFGDDEETTSPTKVQVARCRTEMYIKSSAKITPLGYKLLGSGIDDAIWFKFKSKATNLSEIFNSTVVDTSEFKNAFKLHESKGTKWWDVKDKNMLGGQVLLPNARYMNVGVIKTEQGYLIYVMWSET